MAVGLALRNVRSPVMAIAPSRLINSLEMSLETASPQSVRIKSPSDTPGTASNAISYSSWFDVRLPLRLLPVTGVDGFGGLPESGFAADLPRQGVIQGQAGLPQVGLIV